MSYIGNSPATSTEVADNSVTLAKMAGGTDGNLITYDASGDPAYVTTGTSGQVLTSGGTGVAPTFQTAAAGGGKLLQVIVGQDTTQTIVATTTYTDVGLSATITPSATSSKILCMYVLQANMADTYRGFGSQLVRGSTNILTSGSVSDVMSGNAYDIRASRSYFYLDSPSTTSATTYKVQVATRSGSGVTFNTNGNQTSLVLMEIGA